MMMVVHVIEARSLPAMDRNGLSDPYAKIQLGKHREKTKVVKKSLNPVWDEEFRLRVGDLGDELVVSVIDEDKYFNDDFIGSVRVPLHKVFDQENLSLGTAWYPLQPKNKKSKHKECGEICLSISLSHRIPIDDRSVTSLSYSDDLASNSDMSGELSFELSPLHSCGPTEELSEMRSSLDMEMELSDESDVEETQSVNVEKTIAPSLFDRLIQIITRKSVEVASSENGERDSRESFQENSVNPEANGNKDEDVSSYGSSYEELLNSLESKDAGVEMPENLSGGVLVDQYFSLTPGELNSYLFSPTSKIWESLADIQGTTGLQNEAWRLDGDRQILKRIVTYTKAATKIVKSVKATEEQTYLKADGKSFAILSSASTPDVPFGSTFKTEVLFCITPGPESTPEGQPPSHLVISWRMNFLQSTMMKGMIESGARQGLKDCYTQFNDLLCQNIKPLELKDIGSSKEQILSSLQKEHESDFRLALRFFGNFTVISTIFAVLYAIIHILLSRPSVIQGLEFTGLDLPDSIGEVVVCGILVLQGERVFSMIGRFLQARRQRGSDHGVKAQGDGWLLTVALLEGNNLAAADSTGFSDPYVVFTCNGKKKTSSIKFQTLNPTWNEIFEFDAMEDPPSVIHADVYDFDGPFDEATSLGRTEINLVKSNISDLADIWIPLDGKLAQACQSKLHVRIFLNNSRGAKVVTEYLSKMEKEVGKKINQRSPQTNSTFQKLFGLPPVEFLINDFTCHLKRKMPVQGRLFLSPRIIGFYSNLFGHKTKFFFLWEDIEDIQVVPPTLTSMGSPSLIIILRRGRGMDAKHGAKTFDQDGRLKYHFQSFASFGVANRMIMALWKARSLSPEQKMQIIEEDSEAEGLRGGDDSGSFLGTEVTNMSEIFSATIPVAASSLAEMFEGGALEFRVMERIGCAEYSVTPWEPVKLDTYQRQIHYKFDKNLYRYGGEVTSTQQKSPLLPDKNGGGGGWIIEEVMALQSVLLSEYFNLHLRFQIEDLVLSSRATKACSGVQVSLGISWLKSTKHQKRITKNVMTYSAVRLKEMFRQVEKEFVAGK